METVAKSQDVKILKRIAEGMLKAQREVDELMVQLALGKAEAYDKFEEIKKGFSQQVTEFKKALRGVYGESLSEETKQKIEALESQLAEGKATTKEIWEEQRTKILAVLHTVEQEMKEWLKKTDIPSYFEHEIETFKLKLEILRLKFGLKKFEIKEKTRERLHKTRKDIVEVAEKLEESIHAGADAMEEWRSRMSKAFYHLRDSIK